MQEDKYYNQRGKGIEIKYNILTSHLQDDNSPLVSFSEVMDDLHDAVLSTESSPLVDSPCACGKGNRTTRCTDCSQHDPVCDTCFIKEHISTPFHRVEKWNGRFFQKGTQGEMGRKLHIGHSGRCCPNLPPNQKGRHLDVIDVNGTHSFRTFYCHCPSMTDAPWKQLTKATLFPSSIDRPSTVFTFGVMKLFQLLSTIGKTSAMDFVQCLKRRTDGAFPGDAQVLHCCFEYSVLNV